MNRQLICMLNTVVGKSRREEFSHPEHARGESVKPEIYMVIRQHDYSDIRKDFEDGFDMLLS